MRIRPAPWMVYLVAPAAAVAVGIWAIVTSKGELHYPPGATKITSDYRARTNAKGLTRRSPHQGIDIEGPRGMEILSAAPGTVVSIPGMPCWGPTVVIDHGIDMNGQPLFAAYGHVDKIKVGEGQRVARGQPVAELGPRGTRAKCSGGVRHLHFQLGRTPQTRNEAREAGGYMRIFKDGMQAPNPHKLWANGPYEITCFEKDKEYRVGTLTYPIPCSR